MTLLWPLWLVEELMTLMTIRVYYCHYFNGERLFALLLFTKTIIRIIALIAIIAIIYFCAYRLPKVKKSGRIPGLTGGKHSYIGQAAIAANIS